MCTEDVFFFQTPDNVLAIGNLSWLDRALDVGTKGTRAFVFKDPVPELSDYIALPGMVLVIAGESLWRSDGSGGRVEITKLPGKGFRFGQRVARYGLSSRILVFGNVNGRGVVLDLKPDGTYTKVLDCAGKVTAAGGGFGSTAVAVDGRVLMLTPRYEPSTIFEAPKHVGIITSILARAEPGAMHSLNWAFPVRRTLTSVCFS